MHKLFNDSMFRELDAAEEQEFRKWARENFDALVEPPTFWHPIIRDEWGKLLRGADVPQ